jgi:hypothetical protein
MTGGQSYADDADELAEAARAGTVFRPLPEGVRSALPLHQRINSSTNPHGHNATGNE